MAEATGGSEEKAAALARARAVFYAPGEAPAGEGPEEDAPDMPGPAPAPSPRTARRRRLLAALALLAVFGLGLGAAFRGGAPGPAPALPRDGLRLAAETPAAALPLGPGADAWPSVRAAIEAGHWPTPGPGAVGSLVNAFGTGAAPVPAVSLAPTPWNPATRLLGLRLPRALAPEPPFNLVLLDAAGEAGARPLVQEAAGRMLAALGPGDELAVVAAGARGAPATLRLRAEGKVDPARLASALAVTTGPMTPEAMALAQETAAGMTGPGETVRILWLTDRLPDRDPAPRLDGADLSILGLGPRIDAPALEALARRLGGTAGLAPDAAAARALAPRALLDLPPAGAAAPGAGITFDPAVVASYRPVGGPTGGAGVARPGARAVTLFYELTLAPGAEARGAPVAVLQLRWPDGRSEDRPIPLAEQPGDSAMGFAAAVAGFGEMLRARAGAGIDRLASLAEAAIGADPGGAKARAVALMRRAATLGP